MPERIRRLLEGERNGVLATLSSRRPGWPFASVAAFALSQQGEPLLLLSDLAEHTRNLLDNPRASLLVQDQASLADPQAGARVTLLGEVEALPDDEIVVAQARYAERHPRAVDYLLLADFRFYVLRVQEARFIAGFGDMGWIDGETLRATFSQRAERG